MALFLAVDSGSQSTKVALVDEHGEVHASARRPLSTTLAPAPGQVVHPDDDLWDALAGAVRDLLAGWEGDPSAIAAVGLCGIRCCRALLDAEGRLVEPVLSWMDERVARPPAPDARVASVCSAGGYLARRLTGERRDSVAAYEDPWPVDLVGRGWSEHAEAYEDGWRRDLLPDLVEPGAELGRLLPGVAAALSLPAGLPVHATANDKAVEALGCGLTLPAAGDAGLLLSLGTYVAAMTPLAGPLPAGSAGAWSNAACVPGQWLAESAGVRRGMWTVSWVERLLAGDVVTLGERAADVPPGCGGLVAVLDWLAPVDAPHRRGALVGFDGTQEAPAVFRAVLEGVVLTMGGHIAGLEAAVGRRHGEVVVSGGGSHSDLVMRVVADVLDRPARRPRVRDAVVMGAAVCAAVGSGAHAGWDAAVASMVRLEDPVAPEPDGVEAYAAVARRHALVREGLGRLTAGAYA